MADIFDWLRETVLFSEEDVDGAILHFVKAVDEKTSDRFMKKLDTERGHLEFAKVATETALLFCAAAAVQKDEDFDIVVSRFMSETQKDDVDMAMLRRHFVEENENLLASGDKLFIPQIMDVYRSRVKRFLSIWNS